MSATQRKQSAGAVTVAVESTGEPMFIELSQAQVDRVVRCAAATGSVSVLLSGLLDVREAVAGVQRHLDDARLSSSLLYGLLLLAIFPADGSYMSNAEASRLLRMGASTTHRYISTLAAVGLLERNPTTRQYRRTDVG
jgi:hypothetical protein